MNKNIIILLLLALTVLSCQEEDFQALSFFELQTGSFEDELDRVELQASITNGARETNIEYGFLYSSENAIPSFSDNVIALDKTFASNTTEEFSISTDFIKAGTPYFYRAFARSAGRSVLGEVRMFVAGQQVGVGMNTDNITVVNNEASLGGFVAGLLRNYGRSAINHGHVYAKTDENNDPTKGASDVISTEMGEIAGDRFFTSKATDLDFNTNYIVKAYVQTDEENIFYSEAFEFKIRDGWRLHSSLDLEDGIQNAIAFTRGLKAYLGIGCPNVCDEELAVLDLFEFDPTKGKMENIQPFNEPNPFAAGRANGVSFVIRDTVYVGGGAASSIGSNFAPGDLYYFFPEKSDPFEQWIFADNGEPYEEMERSGAVVFVIGNKAYYGLGEDANNNQLSDFYEFDPDKIANFENPFRPLASLDVAIDGDCTNRVNEGRTDAVSFVLNGKGYVLTGVDRNNGALSDLWSFDPLGNGGNGTWNCIGEFPGGARLGASAFVIGDKAYVTSGGQTRTGVINQLYTDIWSFDGTNWEQKTAFAGTPRRNAVAFSLEGKGYLATGRFQEVSENGILNETLSDIWEYTPEE
ncbi:MAG: hypothetical protein AAGI49_03305 [Bacteroidota bacterium]